MKQLKQTRNYVYVQNWNGKPLMPTNPARARQLLKSGRAEVVSYDIFTIRLKCWSKGYKQPITLGVDSGHAHIGIADNLNAELLDWNYKCRCFRRHNRSLHQMTFSKGHKRPRTIAKYWLGKTQIFTQYDRVLCNGVECFISGSTNGYATIVDIDGNKTAGVKNAITTNKLKLIRHASHGCLIDKIQNVNSTRGDFCR